jgi:hypothetical protein
MSLYKRLLVKTAQKNIQKLTVNYTFFKDPYYQLEKKMSQTELYKEVHMYIDGK